MIRLERINDIDNQHLEPLIELYTQAFPVEERRETAQLKRLIANKPDMYFNAIIEGGENLAGLFVYWDLGDFYYLEHLAVYAEMRNRKIGQQLLDYIHTHLNKPQVLEVEPVADEMTERRVNYYLRNGYDIADKDYFQPSYKDKNLKGYPLWLMAKPAMEAALISEYAARIKAAAYHIED